jgi:hypothetical protein
MNEMKPFQKQFQECSTAGYLGKGSFESFADHPELMPLLPSKKMRKAITSGEFSGVQRHKLNHAQLEA